MSSPDDKPKADPAPSPEPITPKKSWAEASGWVTSLLVHGVVALLLTVISFPAALTQTFDLISEATLGEDLSEDLSLEEAIEFDVDSLTDALDAVALDDPVAAPVALDLAAAAALPSLTDSLTATSLTESIDLGAKVDFSGVGTDGRSAEGKAALVASKGGTKASEIAVARGIKWIVNHQNPDGTWSLVHNRHACRGRCGNPTDARGKDPYARSLISGTGLALLPLLGAGQTHKSGRYRKEIGAGLDALVRLGKTEKDQPGISWRDSGNMYSHGIAMIVLCEAYSLTGDERLRGPAEAAVAYAVGAQDPRGGGWRYRPRQAGDTSVTGWQVMGLKSAALAGLNPPSRVGQLAMKFLDSTSTNDGAGYGYVAPDPEDEKYRPRAPLTAVGLLCRQYLGWGQDDPRLIRGVQTLAEKGPIKHHYYHNYYASQAIFHQTGGVGATWRKWNEAARDQLIDLQEIKGHEKGSWWGKGHHNERGGRLYATAMATMTLEVYYRYLPIYQKQAVADEDALLQ